MNLEVTFHSANPDDYRATKRPYPPPDLLSDSSLQRPTCEPLDMSITIPHPETGEPVMTRYDHRQPPASPRYIASVIAVFVAALCVILARPAHAGELVGPVIDELPAPVAAPALKETRCLARWRLINIGAQVADIGTTVAGLESGKGTEANPLIRAAFGKHPKWYELVGFKAATFALTEWQAQRALDRGDSRAACRQHKIGAIITAGVAAINLRLVF